MWKDSHGKTHSWKAGPGEVMTVDFFLKFTLNYLFNLAYISKIGAYVVYLVLTHFTVKILMITAKPTMHLPINRLL